MSIRGLNEILKDRQEEYGDAETNFTTIGIIWGALLGIPPIPAYQVALLMDSLKTVRLFTNETHEDSWSDKSGYIQHGRKIVGIDES
jgi:hypothetical protein